MLPIFIEVYQPIHASIKAKQHDAKSRYLDVTFLDQGVPFDLGRDDVFLYAVKPDGHAVFNYCEIIEPSQGRFVCELTDQLLAVPGCVKAEFVVYGFDGVEILKTYTFIIEVMPTIYDANAVESTNEFDGLSRLLRKANKIIPLLRDISDRIGWPFPGDEPNLTLFDWMRLFNIMLTAIRNRVDALDIDALLSLLSNTLTRAEFNAVNAVGFGAPRARLLSGSLALPNFTSGTVLNVTGRGHISGIFGSGGTQLPGIVTINLDGHISTLTSPSMVIPLSLRFRNHLIVTLEARNAQASVTVWGSLEF